MTLCYCHILVNPGVCRLYKVMTILIQHMFNYLWYNYSWHLLNMNYVSPFHPRAYVHLLTHVILIASLWGSYCYFFVFYNWGGEEFENLSKFTELVSKCSKNQAQIQGTSPVCKPVLYMLILWFFALISHWESTSVLFFMLWGVNCVGWREGRERERELVDRWQHQHCPSKTILKKKKKRAMFQVLFQTQSLFLLSLKENKQARYFSRILEMRILSSEKFSNLGLPYT